MKRFAFAGLMLGALIAAPPLRCQWALALTVKRIAVSGMQASRSVTHENALKGSAPGWCSSNSKGIQRIVDARRDSLRQTMMAMVAQDRAVILAEADNAKSRASAG